MIKFFKSSIFILSTFVVVISSILIILFNDLFYLGTLSITKNTFFEVFDYASRYPPLKLGIHPPRIKM